MVKTSLLSTKTAKMDKSKEYNYISAVLHLEPALDTSEIAKNTDSHYSGALSQIDNTCPDAGICRGVCIAKTGRMRFANSALARLRRTDLFFTKPDLFFGLLDVEIQQLKDYADRSNMGLTLRLNGTSDIAWELIKDRNGLNVFERHPNVQFVDYTKTISRLRHNIRNYRLIYSINEQSNLRAVNNMLRHGYNASIVLDLDKSDPMPDTYKIGRSVWRLEDGDLHDLLNLRSPGTLIGLRYKQAFSDRTGKAIDVPKYFVERL